MKLVTTKELVEAIVERGASGGRTLTAIAGPPGSGKTFLAGSLTDALNRLEPGSAALVPMDGYHFDDIVLNARGVRDRKGSPETFDVAGFQHILSRLQNNAEDAVAIPLFDRKLEIARAGAHVIGRSVRFLIVEGNYLLLDHAPWRALREHFRSTVMVDTNTETLRNRLTRRWIDLGLERDVVSRKVEGNDMPNVAIVLTGSAPAEFVVTS